MFDGRVFSREKKKSVAFEQRKLAVLKEER